LKTSKKTILITLTFLLTCGCNEKAHSDTPGNSASRPLGTIGIMNYLDNLPAVKKVSKWSNSYGQGILITTNHYDIYTTLMEPLMLRQIPAFMESAHRAYQQQLPKPIKTETRLKVYLFEDRDQWERFTRDFAGVNADAYMQITKGAYYLNGACVTYNIGRTSTFSVLAHEGWHQFNSKHFAFRLPSWLDEGIATLFEKSKYEKGNFSFQPGMNLGRLGALKQSIISKNMIPLRRLIALNPGQVVHNTDSVTAFYSQSYALVRFLREDDYGRRLRKYQNLLLGALRGTWKIDPRLKEIAANRNIPITVQFNDYVSTKLFELYIGEDFNTIEKQYRAYCNKIVYNIRLKK
jgi:hypothetical protein